MKFRFVMLLAGRLLATGAQAVVVILAARSVSVEDFGRLSAMISVGLFLMVIFDFGTSSAVVKGRASGSNDHVFLASKTNLYAVPLSFIATAVPAVLIGGHDFLFGFLVLGLGLSLDRYVDCRTGIAIADQRPYIPAVSILIRRTSALFIYLIFVVLGLDSIQSYAWSFLLGVLVGQAHSLAYIRVAKTDTGIGRIGPFLRMSLPFYLSNLSAQSRLLDSAILAHVATPFQAGLYAAGNRLTSPLLIIPNVISSLVLPAAVKADPQDRRRMTRKLELGAFVSCLLLAPTFLVLPFITSRVFGEAYLSAAGPFFWLLMSVPLVGLASPLGSILQAENQGKFVATNGLVFGIITIAAIAAGASGGGGTGAAVAICIVFLFKCVSLHIRIYRKAVICK